MNSTSPGPTEMSQTRRWVAQFRVIAGDAQRFSGWTNGATDGKPVDLLAWTTTPWTLPSNTALTVGANIAYNIVRTANRYTGEEGTVVLAEALYAQHFSGKKAPESEVLATVKGSDLVGLRYEQLIPWAQPMSDADQAFRVIEGDFVTTEDGTGIVHTAPRLVQMMPGWLPQQECLHCWSMTAMAKVCLW